MVTSDERRTLYLQALCRAIGEADAALYAADQETFDANHKNIEEAKRLLAECR